MGVMACCRIGCDNIMCDRCSNRHGYICDECFDELLQRVPDISIEDFMIEYKRRSFDDGDMIVRQRAQQLVKDTFV